MATTYETNLAISNAQLREIGRIIAHWSLLEILVGTAIAQLKGLDPKAGRKHTLGMRVDRLTDELSSASGNLSTRHRQQMHRLIGKIKKEHVHRNDVAHGIWARYGNRWHLLRYRKPHQINLGTAKRMTASDLERIGSRITALTRGFEKWLDGLGVL